MRAFGRDLLRLSGLGALAVALLVGVGTVFWLDGHRAPSQPSLWRRPFLPRGAQVGDLVVHTPPAYRVSVDGPDAWVVRTWPTLDRRQTLTALRIRTGRSAAGLAAWATREAECATRVGQCRVRTDTVRGTEVRCRETAGRNGDLAEGMYVGVCRAVGGTAMAVYPCADAACEELHQIAIASLASTSARGGSQPNPSGS